MVKEQSRQGHHQMKLRQTADLDFDGNTGMNNLEISLDSLHMRYSESVPRNAESVPVKISSLSVGRSVRTQEQLAVGMLLESVTARQTVQRLLDEDEDVERVERAWKEEEEDVDVEEVEWMRRIWTRPKKSRSSEY
ncbi:MAG: hypothetical protein GY821_00650 [Gammaproteobacteria bacterium]|nr:hypothetical protein [Gammaproteobacteria bacterium]